jgi:hypothetical protein
MEDIPYTRPWEEIVARKRAIRDAEINKYLPTVWENSQPPWPSKEERAITGITELRMLQEKIRSGELTAEAVVRAYIKRHVIPHIQIVLMAA